MSQPQYCNNCDFCDGMFVNFGDNPIAIRLYHGNFTCPKCGTERSTTEEEVIQDLRDLYEKEGWGEIEDQFWWEEYKRWNNK